MAKVKCAKCGHIFAVTAIDEIQTCDVCGQRMRVRPGAASGNDEYASLRNEYMRLAREKRETRSGVYLTIEQYNQLIRQADAGAAALAAPQPVMAQPVATAQPAVATTTIDPALYAYGAAVAQPVATAQPAAPAAQPASPAQEEKKVKPAKLTKVQTIMNWVTFGVVFIAAVFAGLILAFSITKPATIKGWDMLATSITAGEEGAGLGWLLQMYTGIVVFLPALLMIISLINTLKKGKTGKFVLSPFFLIAGVLIWTFPYLYSYLAAGMLNGSFEGLTFSFVDMLKPTAFGWIIWVAAIMCVVAFVMLIVGGAMIPSKKKRIKIAEEQESAANA